MDLQSFEQIVAEAIDALPAEFQEQLENIDIIIEDWPAPAILLKMGLSHPAQLLGLYQGIPQTRRTHRYGLVMPDKITLYQKPIELRGHTFAQIRATVTHVLRHEIAHHFGISDDRLKELGAY